MKLKTVLAAALTILALPLLAADSMTNRTVSLTWDPLPADQDIQGFVIYHGPDEAGPFTTVMSVAGTATNANHTGLDAGIHWWYVAATNFWGVEGPPSGKVSTPAAPTKVGMPSIARTPTGVEITWPANPGPEEISGYRVYSGTDVGNIGSFQLLSTTTNQVHQEAMSPGFRAFFVTASNIWGEGFRSEITTVPALPTAPTGLGADPQ